MASFLYFLPGSGNAKELLAEHGFAHALEYGTPSAIEQTGPAGSDVLGLLCVPASKDTASPSYSPDTQVWRRAAGGKVWVGYEKDRKPTPDVLLRNDVRAGYRCKLADDQEWVIPAAALFPAALDLDDEDRVVRKVLPQYVQLSLRAAVILDGFMANKGDFDMTDAELFESATEALAVNYCVGRVEVALLGLLTTDTARAVVYRFLDFPNYQEEKARGEEKNEVSSITAT